MAKSTWWVLIIAVVVVVAIFVKPTWFGLMKTV